MWGLLLKALGIGLPAIVNELGKARRIKLDATTEQERIAADERIDILNIRKEIILQAQKDRAERWVRILFALPFVIYIWKLILWDKVLELGATDPLSPTLEYILWTVLGGYFMEVFINKFRGR